MIWLFTLLLSSNCHHRSLGTSWDVMPFIGFNCVTQDSSQRMKVITDRVNERRGSKWRNCSNRSNQRREIGNESGKQSMRTKNGVLGRRIHGIPCSLSLSSSSSLLPDAPFLPCHRQGSSNLIVYLSRSMFILLPLFSPRQRMSERTRKKKNKERKRGKEQ